MSDAERVQEPATGAQHLTRRRFLQRAAFGTVVGAASAGAAYRWWPRRRPNLLLVTLDTTRADRVGCYGYDQAETPVLDALARDGILFEKAYVSVPETLPSHTSMLTGLYPPETGVRNNVHGRLAKGVPTLATILKQEGYATSAFIAAIVLSSRYGLNQGFDVYDDDMAGGERHGDETRLMRSGRLVADAALAWLAAHRSQPFFSWVHLFDPHAPYESHPEVFGDQFRDRPYDGDVAYADRQLGRIIDFLKQRALFDQTLIMVVGDHGEGFGEHEELEHGFLLYNSTLRVPLIVRPSDSFSAGYRVPTPVSLVDLLPTALECLGVHAPEPVSGVSFRPALRGEPIAPRECWSSTNSAYAAFGWSPLTSITTDQWKYVRSTEEELYDLTSDPNELHNLAATNPQQIKQMRQQLETLEGQMTPRAQSDATLSEHERRALAGLGYVSGAGTATPSSGDRPLPDVKRMIGFYNAEMQARQLLREKRIEEAIHILEPVIEKAPEFLPARLRLGAAYEVQQKPDRAEQVYRAALEVNPDSSEAHFDLAKLLHSTGRTKEAVKEYEAALKSDPDFAMAHFNLATLLLTRGDTSSARQHYEMGLEIFPESTIGHFNYGVLLAGTGEVDEAERHLTRAAELSPRDPRIHFQLGRVLATQGRWSEAAASFEETLRRNPQFPGAEEQLENARSNLLSIPRFQ